MPQFTEEDIRETMAKGTVYADGMSREQAIQRLQAAAAARQKPTLSPEQLAERQRLAEQYKAERAYRDSGGVVGQGIMAIEDLVDFFSNLLSPGDAGAATTKPQPTVAAPEILGTPGNVGAAPPSPSPAPENPIKTFNELIDAAMGKVGGAINDFVAPMRPKEQQLIDAIKGAVSGAENPVAIANEAANAVGGAVSSAVNNATNPIADVNNYLDAFFNARQDPVKILNDFFGMGYGKQLAPAGNAGRQPGAPSPRTGPTAPRRDAGGQPGSPSPSELITLMRNAGKQPGATRVKPGSPLPASLQAGDLGNASASRSPNAVVPAGTGADTIAIPMLRALIDRQKTQAAKPVAPQTAATPAKPPVLSATPPAVANPGIAQIIAKAKAPATDPTAQGGLPTSPAAEGQGSAASQLLKMLQDEMMAIRNEGKEKTLGQYLASGLREGGMIRSKNTAKLRQLDLQQRQQTEREKQGRLARLMSTAGTVKQLADEEAKRDVRDFYKREFDLEIPEGLPTAEYNNYAKMKMDYDRQQVGIENIQKRNALLQRELDVNGFLTPEVINGFFPNATPQQRAAYATLAQKSPDLFMEMIKTQNNTAELAIRGKALDIQKQINDARMKQIDADVSFTKAKTRLLNGRNQPVDPTTAVQRVQEVKHLLSPSEVSRLTKLANTTGTLSEDFSNNVDAAVKRSISTQSAELQAQTLDLQSQLFDDEAKVKQMNLRAAMSALNDKIPDQKMNDINEVREFVKRHPNKYVSGDAENITNQISYLLNGNGQISTAALRGHLEGIEKSKKVEAEIEKAKTATSYSEALAKKAGAGGVTFVGQLEDVRKKGLEVAANPKNNTDLSEYLKEQGGPLLAAREQQLVDTLMRAPDSLKLIKSGAAPRLLFFAKNADGKYSTAIVDYADREAALIAAVDSAKQLVTYDRQSGRWIGKDPTRYNELERRASLALAGLIHPRKNGEAAMVPRVLVDRLARNYGVPMPPPLKQLGRSTDTLDYATDLVTGIAKLLKLKDPYEEKATTEEQVRQRLKDKKNAESN